MRILTKIYYKFKIDILWNRLASFFTRLFWVPLNIMTPSQTIEHIINTKCSVARFGDGELHIVAYCCPIKFQKADKQLQQELQSILTDSQPDLLLCLPNRLNIIKKNERRQLPLFWQKSLPVHLYAWTKNIQKKRLYGDTNLSRITNIEEYESVQQYIDHVKRIWEDRNIIMIEGEKTRFGVGNNLFDNAKTVKRILGPAESAFSVYDRLLDESAKLSSQIEDPIVLIALGPTATVLASDLSKLHIQSIDIGHLDICYEQYKNGNQDAVKGKYTNEAKNGNIVEDCLDPEYLSQIVLKLD